MNPNTHTTSPQEQASHADRQARLGRRSFMAGLTGIAALSLGGLAPGWCAATGVERSQQLFADDGAANDEFGTSVAIDKATETIVVGAPFNDNENGRMRARRTCSIEPTVCVTSQVHERLHRSEGGFAYRVAQKGPIATQGDG